MNTTLLILYSLSEARKLFALVGFVGLFFSGFCVLFALDKGSAEGFTKAIMWCVFFFFVALLGLAMPSGEILDRLTATPTVAEIQKIN